MRLTHEHGTPMPEVKKVRITNEGIASLIVSTSTQANQYQFCLGLSGKFANKILICPSHAVRKIATEVGSLDIVNDSDILNICKLDEGEILVDSVELTEIKDPDSEWY